MSAESDDSTAPPVAVLRWVKGITDRIQPMARLGLAELEQRAEKVPVLAWAKAQRDQIERELLRRLRERMDELGVTEPPRAASTSGPAAGPATAVLDEAPSAAEMLGRLIQAGLRQTAAEAQEAMLQRTVSELVPDEARLLTAMVGETGHAMIHVNIGRQRVLSYVTAAARAANIKSKDMAERYIHHLLDLHLIEVGPEDSSNPLEYELLESAEAVRDALEGTEGPRLIGRPRIERGTVRLSALGQALWASYSGDPAAEPHPRFTARESS